MDVVIVLLVLIKTLILALANDENSPNIVFILTDDQDVNLGGLEPMTKTKRLIGDEGITFINMFATTPICCPSRSSILTGNYQHNTGVVNNSVSGGCSSRRWQEGAERRTFATSLKQRGYKTFFAGKYLNQYGKQKVGGVKHVPPGWDSWVGLVGNSKYYNYRLSVNGVMEEHGHDYHHDYLTDLINKRGSEFLKRQTRDTPFFMMLSTPSCHAPFTPAPQYSSAFANKNAPRTGSYNVHGKDKHWLLRVAPNPMSKVAVNASDFAFRNRWRTLLSVDDLVENVMAQLKDQNLLNNTYIFFSSDNGYHLGEFSLPMDKRQMYEFDIRVPLMVRGPGVKSGQISKDPVLTIDLAPTFINIAGVRHPPEMDGVSMLPKLASNQYRRGYSQSYSVNSIDQSNTTRNFLVEYHGEYDAITPGCPQFNHQYLSNCFPACVCEDARNNTYSCVRSVGAHVNHKFCKFADDEEFVEVYDLNSDPDELVNLAPQLTAGTMEHYDKLLHQLSTCAGLTCHVI